MVSTWLVGVRPPAVAVRVGVPTVASLKRNFTWEVLAAIVTEVSAAAQVVSASAKNWVVPVVVGATGVAAVTAIAPPPPCSASTVTLPEQAPVAIDCAEETMFNLVGGSGTKVMSGVPQSVV